MECKHLAGTTTHRVATDTGLSIEHLGATECNGFCTAGASHASVTVFNLDAVPYGLLGANLQVQDTLGEMICAGYGLPPALPTSVVHESC